MAAGPIGPGVKVMCKACGNQATADSFKLHYAMRLMVCPNCYSGKNAKERAQKEIQKAVDPPRPPGWDSEDEYLERAAKLRRDSPRPQFSRVPGTDFVRYSCSGCSYNFKYDTHTKTPRSCPYCNVEVPTVKASYLV